MACTNSLASAQSRQNPNLDLTGTLVVTLISTLPDAVWPPRGPSAASSDNLNHNPNHN